MNTIELEKPIKSDFLDDNIVKLGISYYSDNGALAMLAMNPKDEYLADVTVNLPETNLLDKFSFFLNANDTAKAVANNLMDNQIVKRLPMTATSGFNVYHAYTIVDDNFKKQVAKAINN